MDLKNPCHRSPSDKKTDANKALLAQYFSLKTFLCTTLSSDINNTVVRDRSGIAYTIPLNKQLRLTAA